MDVRQIKAQQIVATERITRGNGYWLVPSRSGAARHKVVLDGLFPNCSCAAFELTGGECPHMLAVRLWLAELESGTPAERTDPTQLLPRPTYKRDWASINAAATTEHDWVVRLLSDLTRDIPDPERPPTRGTRPLRLADALFAAIYKTYSGLSARRFTCSLTAAADRGHITRPMHFNTVLGVLDTEAVTPILHALIAKSASPFRGIDFAWAVDSTGFASASKRERWFNTKYGVPQSDAHWVKCHALCSTSSTVVAAAEVLDKHSGDSPQFPGLIDAAHRAGFILQTVTADKAYAGNPNFNAVEKAGGTLYTPFRSNTTGAVGGLFEKAFHFFSLHRDEFLSVYHRRSLIESAFSSIKRVFGETVRAKTDTAMKNEVLAKIVAHNLRCVVLAIYELGLNPVFGFDDNGPDDDGPRDVLPFPGCTSLKGPALHKPAG